MAQWLLEGLTATISGVLTVFLVLILIALIIGSLQFVINPKKTIDRIRMAAAKRKQEKADPDPVALPATENVAVALQQDDRELVAVITAAIAASLNVSSDKLMVRSIRRVEQSRGWSRR